MVLDKVFHDIYISTVTSLVNSQEDSVSFCVWLVMVKLFLCNVELHVVKATRVTVLRVPCLYSKAD